MGRTLRILHISDLHARSADGPQKERARRDAAGRWRVLGPEWERNLGALRDDGVPIDVVTFTGDLGDWGDPTDYPMAVAFLRRTCERVGVPIERLFLVPGNHDIARGEASDAWKGLRAGFGGTARAGSDWMAGGKAPPGLVDGWRDAVATRQQAFWRAVCDDLGRGELAPWRHRHGRLGYQQRVELVGLAAPLWIVGLDTSWLCGGDDDSGKLYLTEHQVGMLTNDDAGAPLEGFRLALMHHRFADLADGERARRLLADRVDLVLHGHQHEAAVEPWASPDHKLLVLAAGCLYEGDEGLRYLNAFQVIDVELTDAGRPVRAAIRFRGWAERNGLFWGDDALLYRNAPGGRLRLVHEDGGWKVETGPRLRVWEPRAAEVFVGREAELRAIDAGVAAEAGARVAVVAVQGMPGVGKTYLVEQWCARNGGRFGKLCRWVIDPLRPAEAKVGLLTLAAQAGIDTDRTPVSELPLRLETMGALVHVDNVDGEDAAKVVVSLLRELPKNAAIVTGRYTALGTSKGTGWHRVEVACFSPDDAVALLRNELGAGAPPDADLRRLAVSVGGLPLALHLAAGYLGRAYTVEAFLKRLSDSGLSLEHVDLADPLMAERCRGVIRASFEVSKELLLQEGGRRGKDWIGALAALGWTVPEGFETPLGAAVLGLDETAFHEFMDVAWALSLVHRVPPSDRRPDGAWSVHPLIAEYLRARGDAGAVWTRVGEWIAQAGRDDQDAGRGARWGMLAREHSTVAAWLAQATASDVANLAPTCWQYAVSQGPVMPWLEAVRKAVGPASRPALLWAWAKLADRVREGNEVLAAAERLMDAGDERDWAMAAGLRADILAARGDLDEALRIRREEALPVYERLGDVRSRAVTMGKIADILAARGDLDETLRIRREEALPVYERLGDVRSRAVTLGQIADILAARGDLDEALRIRREEEMPVYERLGDVRSRAVTLGQIADILAARGDLDAALRIRREEELPVFERLGDVRERAVTLGKIADILAARGDLDAALRILREDLSPVFERLGDVRSRAVTLGKIADILAARGDLDEALRIRREEALPVYERLGDVRSRAVTMGQIADIVAARGDLDETLRIRREEAMPVYERLGDVRSRAVTLGQIADILAARGDLDEALRIRREEEMPVYERLGDVRSRAVTMGQIADILAARGDLDEALRIRREEEMPVYERLGDVRSRAVTMGQIADILAARGDLDEALRIRREEALPVYERLGDVRSHAVTLGKIADILAARGDLDEALRIRREEELPAFERLGDVRSRAVTLGKIADILAARGDLDEALRILREQALPVFERLSGRDLAVGLANLAGLLIRRGRTGDVTEARRYLTRSVAMADAMELPFPDQLRAWLASAAGRR